jgi:predicted house-cleaning NTP pyrophosphatase (Maf/HAM1 superfamily)
VQITTKKGGGVDAPATGRIVVRGMQLDNSRTLDERAVIISDTVQSSGKTILLKSNNLKDAEFMAKNFDGAGNVTEKAKVVIEEVKGGSKTSPSLILIDGEKKTKKELDALSPDQIKSVQVLKGESAIKEYGAEAKDGVIKITTKKKVNL